jgi:hypothetical protein
MSNSIPNTPTVEPVEKQEEDSAESSSDTHADEPVFNVLLVSSSVVKTTSQDSIDED